MGIRKHGFKGGGGRGHLKNIGSLWSLKQFIICVFQASGGKPRSAEKHKKTNNKKACSAGYISLLERTKEQTTKQCA